MRHTLRNTLVRSVVLLACVGVGFDAAGQADRAAGLRARLTEAGYGEGDEAVQNALQSTDPAAQGIALRVAMLARDESALDAAAELLGSPSLRVRFEAGLLLHSFGDGQGLAVVEDIAGATREVVFGEQHTPEQAQTQLVVIDAAEWFALNGNDGYVYQLSLLMDGAAWAVKTEAAKALGAFRSMSDACQEQAWLVGLDIVRLALAENNPEVDAVAGRLLAALMQGLANQPEVTPAVHAALGAIAEGGLRSGVGVTPSAVRSAVQALEPRLVRAPQIPCAPLDPDPREIGVRAVLSLVSFLNRGIYDSFQEDLDIHGEFQGLSRAEWIEKLKREFKTPENPAVKRIVPLPQTVRQPGPGTVVVSAMVDALNDEAERWDRYDYTFVVEWFGFDWHFARIDSTAWPEDRQPDRDPPRATPPADGPNAEPGALASSLIDALAGGDVTHLRRILSPEGVYLGNLDRTGFIVQLEQNWLQSRPSDFRFTPTEYRFRGEGDGAIVEVDSFNRSLLTPARVKATYTIYTERDPASGALRIARLDIAQTRLP